MFLKVVCKLLHIEQFGPEDSLTVFMGLFSPLILFFKVDMKKFCPYIIFPALPCRGPRVPIPTVFEHKKTGYILYKSAAIHRPNM